MQTLKTDPVQLPCGEIHPGLHASSSICVCF